MIDLLAPGGGLARAIPHYEDRAEQRAMSAAVARALADERPLIVEAGTGTGKTLAYLIPALASGKRIVVSTGTRALQDQIARHDIPLLRSMLARPFSAVVLKGVANYACRRKLAELATRADVEPALRSILDWSVDSDTGDRAEVEWLAEDAPLWRDVTTTPERTHRCGATSRPRPTRASARGARTSSAASSPRRGGSPSRRSSCWSTTTSTSRTARCARRSVVRASCPITTR
jgi:hypothetical protein